MSTTPTAYPIYNLSNSHFQNVEILTTKNKLLKGQFVQLKVVQSANIEYLYPAAKYCFLPEEKKELFWDTYNSNNGEFKEFPRYIKQLGLNDISLITIKPVVSI